MRDAATYRTAVPALRRDLPTGVEAPDHVRGASRTGGTA